MINTGICIAVDCNWSSSKHQYNNSLQ